MNINIKKFIILLNCVILFPLSLLLLTLLFNYIGNKYTNNSQHISSNQQIPQEIKKENSIPTSSSNNSENDNKNNTEYLTKPVPGTEYVVKSGDSIFLIASQAYGSNNANSGIDKIKKENNINNNIQVGQKIKIPE